MHSPYPLLEDISLKSGVVDTPEQIQQVWMRPLPFYTCCFSVFGLTDLVGLGSFCSDVDGFVPPTQQVKLRIVGQPIILKSCTRRGLAEYKSSTV